MDERMGVHVSKWADDWVHGLIDINYHIRMSKNLSSLLNTLIT